MALDSHKTALLVIDGQNECFDGKWPIPDGNAALAHKHDVSTLYPC